MIKDKDGKNVSCPHRGDEAVESDEVSRWVLIVGEVEACDQQGGIDGDAVSS